MLRPKIVCCDRSEHRGLWYTADGRPIQDGMVVWDYDLRKARVDVNQTPLADSTNESHEYWDGWFNMSSPETGARMSVMNGVRMVTVHPYTLEPAEGDSP